MCLETLIPHLLNQFSQNIIIALCCIMNRDVNRKPEIRFSVLKPKSGFRFWKPNFEFIFLNFFTYGKLHKDESKFLKRLIHAFVYNECNYAGRARKIYSCQFPGMGSFDLFRPNEAFYNVLTSAYIDVLTSAYIDGLRGRQRHYYRYISIIVSLSASRYSCKTSQRPI